MLVKQQFCAAHWDFQLELVGDVVTSNTTTAVFVYTLDNVLFQIRWEICGGEEPSLIFCELSAVFIISSKRWWSVMASELSPAYIIKEKLWMPSGWVNSSSSFIQNTCLPAEQTDV